MNKVMYYTTYDAGHRHLWCTRCSYTTVDKAHKHRMKMKSSMIMETKDHTHTVTYIRYFGGWTT